MKIKKVLFIIFCLILFNTISYAKYIYNYDEEIICLKRDSGVPSCTVSYSTQEITNENVTVTLNCNKPVEQVSGFEISEDGKTLTKIITENESKIITLRDLCGNCSNIEYSVNNIDKECPQIIGCEDGGIYQEPVDLKFEDNNEIENIIIDKYSEDLTIEYNNVYYDCADYFGIDRSKNKISVKVKSHPINTVNYKYYINDKLYSTSQNIEYTFTGLEPGCKYIVKVQALDCKGEILKETSINTKTSYFDYINSNKTDSSFCATINGIDSKVDKISYAVWNIYDENNKVWCGSQIQNGVANISFENFDNNYQAYIVHCYMYNENGEVLDIVEFEVDFATVYIKNNSEEEEQYCITESGEYQIKASDFAGNEVEYCIKIK